MNALSEILGSWSHCIAQFCRPMTPHHLDEKTQCHDFNHNSFSIIRDEPSFTHMPRQSAMPSRNTPEVFEDKRASKKRRGFGWSYCAAKKRLSSKTSSSRRPQISAPSDFRHVYSDSFHVPGSRLYQTKLPPTSFFPLDSNLSVSDTQLPPNLPRVNRPRALVTPPPRAYATPSPCFSDRSAISHQRSDSAQSFRIPRRPVPGGLVFDASRSNTPTPEQLRPVRMRPVRGRSRRSPPPPSPIMEDLVERVANAMLERDRLQEKIDDMVEKEYFYTSGSSRPSTDTDDGQPGMEPMPETLARPPNAPSFSERLSSDRVQQNASAQVPARARYEANSSRKMTGRAPPPPLPLRLRPPLRKKKSFSRVSRVSSWLFPTTAAHKREISLDSITNAPKPVTSNQGFYEVALPEANHRSSFDSESTVSDWTVEEQTAFTSLSPSNASSPRAMAGPSKGQTYGAQEPIHHFEHRQAVGIAF
ncbi:hypothetical protein F4808DRAFT_294244 [Astrocystis sublimbata]|nr:hypothetical protein F4808DRAFT_294244 [Astrocystis sublimbata]